MKKKIVLFLILPHFVLSLSLLEMKIDTLFTFQVSDKSCEKCIVENESAMIPIDFCVDSDLNLYLVETVYNDVKKFNVAGTVQWKRRIKTPLLNVIYYSDKQLYLFSSLLIFIVDTESGELLRKVKNPLKRVKGDNIYIYDTKLYAFSEAYNHQKPDSSKVQIFNLADDFSMLPDSILLTTPVLGCIDCVHYFTNRFHIHDIKGQSEKYLLYNMSPIFPEGSDKEIFIFDKKSKKRWITNLSRYYTEPGGFKQFKFATEDQAVFIAIVFNKGIATKGIVLRAALP